MNDDNPHPHPMKPVILTVVTSFHSPYSVKNDRTFPYLYLWFWIIHLVSLTENSLQSIFYIHFGWFFTSLGPVLVISFNSMPLLFSKRCVTIRVYFSWRKCLGSYLRYTTNKLQANFKYVYCWFHYDRSTSNISCIINDEILILRYLLCGYSTRYCSTKTRVLMLIVE